MSSPTRQLVRVKPHRLPTVRTVDASVLPAERDAGVVGRDEAAVRDRDPVGVPRQIAQHLLRSGEWRLASALKSAVCDDGRGKV